MHDEWLPAESVRLILLPADTQQEAQSSRQSQQVASFCGKRSWQEARSWTISTEAKYEGQSRQEDKLAD